MRKKLVTKKAQLERDLIEYRRREQIRKEQMKEISKDFARPGELTREERIKRINEHFRKKREENKCLEE